MKLLTSVVVLSVGLNAALVAAFVAKPALAPAAVRGVFSPGSAATAVESAATKPAPKTRSATPALSVEQWNRLRHDDLPALVARLRAAGFPPAMIRAIAEAEIQQRYSPRLQELRRVLDETPYWRGDATSFAGNNKLYEQMNQLSRERARALRDLLGSDAFAYAGMDPTEAQRQRFGNLSPGKIELVQRITDDYAEMTSQIRAAMNGVTLPEDKEKFALLEREKRADLAAILSPAELDDYEMRTSPVTMRLRTAFTIMDATADEFRAIYAAHQSHQETLYPISTGTIIFTSSDANDARTKATQQIHDRLKQTLGADRFAQYQRASDREFQQIYQLTRAENVPYDTVVRAFNHRQSASEASMKIAQDPALSPEQRRDDLKQLAQQTRTQLLSTLGPGAGPTYTQTARWLSGLEQGRPFTVMPDGNIRTAPIAAPRPTATPKQ